MKLIFFIPNRRVRKMMVLIATGILALILFMKLSFYYHYGVRMSASSFYVVFETHASEASDFLANYFNRKMILLLIVLLIPIFFLYRFFINSISRFRLKGFGGVLLGISMITISVFCLWWKFQKENLMLIVANSYNDYKSYKSSLKHNLAKQESDALVVTSFPKQPQTNIVIIGESTSTWHMQLYGYERETNPLLNEIKEELLIFEDVIAPNVHTILALEKILTLSDYHNPHKKDNGSIIQLANEAGFETYWISNQKPIGFDESVSTLIANASNHTFYVNSEDYMDKIYDENIFSPLDSVLSNPKGQKMIFIHLIGTHIDYSKRFPKTFHYFKDLKIDSQFATDRDKEKINTYDNAVRYNDYIVRSIIEKARNTQNIGYVVYFSDHGDEVYDTMELMGHNEYHATRPMYEVPFLVWLSDDYKTNFPQNIHFKDYVKRRYNLEDFIHSFSDLTDIKFSGFDQTKSIFNENYVERTRCIKENVDYDNR